MNSSAPAFPIPCNDDRDCSGRAASGYGGLTKRELFAAMAMQGFINYCFKNEIGEDHLAKWSVIAADALIAELEKGRP